MNKHTPGHWHRNIPPASKYCTFFAGRNTHVGRVVKSEKMSEEEVEANLNLICAAPELLAALEALMEFTQCDHMSKDMDYYEERRKVEVAALAAIDKARGEKSK